MKAILILAAGAALLAAGPVQEARFTDTFLADEKDFVTTGRHPYFILEPGYQLVLETPDKKEILTITVLEKTQKVGGVETRIVEEHETVDGQVKEVSRNFFAMCRRTNSVYYFGEEVDDYKDGKIVGHDGAWQHGEKGARYGLFLPGLPLVGARYYQEIAPEVAMDRAEILSLSDAFETPAGKFEKVLKTLETSALDPKERSVKIYAPGVGLLKDGDLRLVRYGKGKS